MQTELLPSNTSAFGAKKLMNLKRARRLAVALPATLMLIAGGCDRGPTGPASPARGPAMPPTTPEATFDVSLSGPVVDNVGRPLADARVEVIDGQRRGVFALADASGHYALPGVFSGSVTLRASKAGYLAVTQMFFGGYPGENIFGFRLQTPSSVSLLGNYTLTISVDPTCTAFPFEAQSRTYQATANPAPNSTNTYLVALSGATFSFNYNRVFAAVAGDFVVFRFDSDIDAGLLTEELSPSTTLSFFGQAGGSLDGRSISVPFSGELVYRAANATPIPCSSSNHTLTLTRR
jgi:carboxypeptidase family protein